MSTEVVGLRIKCQQLGRVVNVSRMDYAVGPIDRLQQFYVVRCRCGKVHRIKTQRVSKPTKTKQAQTMSTTQPRERG